jgi:hypothetical protein
MAFVVLLTAAVPFVLVGSGIVNGLVRSSSASFVSLELGVSIRV